MADHGDGPAIENLPEDLAATTDEEEEEEEEEEGFTFAAATRLTGGVIDDGGIGPVYPVFGRPRSPADQEVEEEPGTATVRVPLRQLLLEERGSSSSSGKRPDDEEEGDELDGVPAETYCLWSPGTSPSPSPSPSRCQKSGSTGSVLRWRQRLQVGRSHSDGKEKFVFLQAQQDAAGSPGSRGRTGTGEPRGRGGGVHGWSHRGRGGSGRGSPGRRASTFLPYKQDLLGLFANAGAFRRSYHPF